MSVLGVIRGREEGFPDGTYDLRCVADRALAAAAAYNLNTTRITAVRLEGIEADRG